MYVAGSPFRQRVFILVWLHLPKLGDQLRKIYTMLDGRLAAIVLLGRDTYRIQG